MTVPWKQIALASFVLSTASCSGPSPAPSSDTSGDTGGAGSGSNHIPFVRGPSMASDSQATCIDRVNAYRAANNLSPVQEDAALDACATIMCTYDLEQGDPDSNVLCTNAVPGGTFAMTAPWPSEIPDAIDRTIHADAPRLLVPELNHVGCSVRTNTAGFIAVSLLTFVGAAPPPPCSDSNPCATGYCRYSGLTCPPPGTQGTCTDTSFTCPAFAATQPACGCDGKMYKNDCEAAQAGVQAQSDFSACPVSPGKFRCGFTECAIGSEICVGDSSQADYVHCAPLPAACGGVATCACANDKSVCPHNPPNLIGGLCQVNSGNVFVTCADP